MISTLPLDLNFLKASVNATTASTASSAAGGGGLGDQPFAPSALDTVPEDSLNIAWQYRKYMGGNGSSQQPQGAPLSQGGPQSCVYLRSWLI